MDDKNQQIFDAHSAEYTKEIDSAVAFSGLKADFFARKKAEYLLDFLRGKYPNLDELTLLDLGCGIGTYEPLLNSQVASVTGIDVSALSAAKARHNNPENEYLVYDGRNVPFENDSFDVVFAICVMHHVPVELWPQFVSEAMRVTKPGGLFAIFEHNPWNPLTRHVVASCEFDEDAVLLTPKSIRRAFLEAAIEPANQQVEYMLTLPPAGGFLKSIDRLLKHLRLGAQFAVYTTK